MAGLTPFTVTPQVGVQPTTGAAPVSWAYPSEDTSTSPIDFNQILTPMISVMMLGMLFGMMKPMMKMGQE